MLYESGERGLINRTTNKRSEQHKVLTQCCFDVDASPILKQQWDNVSCLLGYRYIKFDIGQRLGYDVEL